MTDKKKAGASVLIYIVLLAVGIIIGGAGLYLFSGIGGMLNHHDTQLNVENGSGPAKAEKKIKYWQAPMNPSYIRNEPGKSPMGMDLIPVYEGDDNASEPGTVSIDPVTAQNIGVRTKRVETRVLTKTIRTVGRVDYDERLLYHVNTKIEGWVEKLYVDFTGEKVKKDDYLLAIYSPKLVATQEEYLLARSYDRTAGNDLAVTTGGPVKALARKRLELWDVPEHQIRELEESGKIKKTIHVHSPANGVVIKKNVQEGMYVKPGMNLYTIADLSKVWIYADIYEYEMDWVHLGQDAEMELAAYPGRIFKGRVTFINPFMEAKTRTVKVRLEFDNAYGKLKPDMYANVSLMSRRPRASLVVPTEAVLLSGERSLVITTRGSGKFRPKTVRLGVEAGGYYEVLDGLSDGDEVVTSAQFLIDSESRLKEAISKMLEVKKEDNAPTQTGGMNPCGTGGTDSSGMKGMDHSGMKGMDHSGMKDMNPCGTGGTDNSGMKGTDNSGMKGMDHSGMKGMDHSGMEGMDHSGMKDMDHSGMKDMNPCATGGMDNSGMKGMDHGGMGQ